jgi:hypothetical protein
VRFLVEIPRGEGERAMLLAATALVHLVAGVNARRAARGALPRLYESAIQYRPEPPGHPEMIDHAGIVLARGWGDCDDLTAYRLGELWSCGERGARARILWRANTTRYHAEVRRADGTTEDPSRIQVRREKAKK